MKQVRIPLGSLPPRTVNFCGFLRNSTTSCNSFFASSTPLTCSNVTFFIWIGSTAESRPVVVRNLTVNPKISSAQWFITPSLLYVLTATHKQRSRFMHMYCFQHAQYSVHAGGSDGFTVIMFKLYTSCFRDLVLIAVCMQGWDLIHKHRKELKLKQTSIRKGAFTREKGGSWQAINTNK